MESTDDKQVMGGWFERFVSRVRGSAWTPLVAKIALGVLGFFALALVGSGAAADLLPKPAGKYLGPPTVGTATIPTASAHQPTPAPTVLPAQPPPVADAGVDAAPTPSAITADGLVILNLAGEEDLRKLPGIGAKKAQAILALRAKLGKFKRPEDLLRVKGIGRKKLAKLRPRLLIDPPDKP